MKKYLPLLLVFILLISGCIDFPGFQQASFDSPGTSKTDSTDLILDIQAVPSEVKAGKQISLVFDIQAKENILKNLNLNSYDQCIFTGESEYEILELKEQREKIWTWKWIAGESKFEQECNIRFRTEYESEFVKTQDMSVVTESEYYARQERGTLGDITTSISSTTNPLEISVAFSEEQPFIEDDEYHMYINYYYSGDGYLENLKVGDVVIKLPDFISEIDCNSYDIDGNILTLNRELNFIDKKAPQTTCTFKANIEQPIEIAPITITASYKYKFDNSLIIKIIP